MTGRSVLWPARNLTFTYSKYWKRNTASYRDRRILILSWNTELLFCDVNDISSFWTRNVNLEQRTETYLSVVSTVNYCSVQFHLLLRSRNICLSSDHVCMTIKCIRQHLWLHSKMTLPGFSICANFPGNAHNSRAIH